MRACNHALRSITVPQRAQVRLRQVGEEALEHRRELLLDVREREELLVQRLPQRSQYHWKPSQLRRHGARAR